MWPFEGKDKCLGGFGRKTWSDHWKRLCRWEDTFRMYLQEIRWEIVDWISLVQDMDKWQAIVNVALNLRFYKLLEISPVAEELLAFIEGPLRHNKPCNISRKHQKCLCSNTVQEDNLPVSWDDVAGNSGHFTEPSWWRESDWACTWLLYRLKTVVGN
jgi:hypothetical protein